jgi:ABC-type nitrate/sulfonate/bicarbonate transport system substrate-binding protein
VLVAHPPTLIVLKKCALIEDEIRQSFKPTNPFPKWYMLMSTSLNAISRSICTVICFIFVCVVANAQERFSELAGNIRVGSVEKSSTVQIPYILWGGDVATFLANGDLKTKPSTLFQKAGLDIQLTPGDDFVGQVRNYMEGKTPFLRGTMHMIGLAGEVLGSDPRTKPVVIMQLSWSAGDHIVARKGIRSLNDLKGKKIACQQGGPHVGLLYDSLTAAKLNKVDVQIVWTKDITGPEGPAEAFRKDPSIDACCVITPDMVGLSTGLNQEGSGAEGTVAGAHVVNSTAQMSRSIADVYAVRRDWYDANQDWIKKFIANQLKATEQLVAMRKSFEETKKLSKDYEQILALSQRIFGKETLPTLEEDAHGLLLDCSFVGLTGQLAFFLDERNLSGFKGKMGESLDLATGWGYSKGRNGFDPNDFKEAGYKQIAKLAGIEYVAPTAREAFSKGSSAEGTEMFLGENLDSSTIVSFTIGFEPDQKDFSADRYGSDFARALREASKFGNARVIIRGHSDPTRTILDLVKSGLSKGIIQQTGTTGNYRYFLNGKPLDLSRTKEVIELIKGGTFGGGNPDPTVTMQAALSLSKSRADSVFTELKRYAKDSDINIDLSQIVPVGAGVTEPIIPKPRNLEEAKENMRVEFRIVKVNPESLAPSDFNF